MIYIPPRLSVRIRRLGAALTAMAASASVLVAVSAQASVAVPVWKLYMQTPQSVRSGEPVPVTIGLQNMGDQRTSSPVTVSYTVSAGLMPPNAEAMASIEYSGAPLFPLESFVTCQGAGTTVTCTIPPGMAPRGQIVFKPRPVVSAQAAGVLTNSVVASGGGTSRAVAGEQSMTVGPRASYGLANVGVSVLRADGSPALQAGSDPAEFTTSVQLRTFAVQVAGGLPLTAPVELGKDVITHLPAGLTGNPTATPRCTSSEMNEESDHGFGEFSSDCPSESQVGIVHAFVGGESFFAPLYNVVPAPGVAATFGFNIAGVVVLLNAHVRSDGGVDVVARNISTTLSTTAADVTLWGVPADSSHDHLRGACVGDALNDGPFGAVCPSSAPHTSFLRLPTSCPGSPLGFAFETDSWANPGEFMLGSAAGPVLSGCEVVPFEPSMTVAPTSSTPESPSGLDVRLSMPQNSNPEGLAESDLRDATVTSPPGMTLNPSAAGGLGACTDGELALGSTGPAACPGSSKIGTVTVKTPLLEELLEGSVFLRTQNSSDPASGEMYRVAVEIRDDARGINIKIPGEVRADPLTGQVTTLFDDLPQQPFSEFQLHLKSGSRAPLVTPAGCGPQAVSTQLTGWNGVLREPAAGFSVACAGGNGFSPVFSAGTTSPQAGAFSPFVLSFSRQDGEQLFAGVQQTLAPGLLARIAGIPLCSDADAAAGVCSAASQIGTVTAGVGVGPDPFYVTGRIYLTGAYNGGPFGEVVVIPAVAGPFNLGTVVLRGSIRIDPRTAQATVVSDAFPQIVAGVPVHLRRVVVTLDRPGFTFNPTNCEPLAVTGVLSSVLGAQAPVSTHFQAVNCATLGFKPSFTVATSAHTSKLNGASLHVHLATHEAPGSAGNEANIRKVEVSLPVVLPSRLTTLQKACTEAQFNNNPSGCPEGAFVGTAVAHTPVLSNPLSGPAILVSHGGAGFPDLVLTLSGEGIHLSLVGHTDIKKGITFSRFETVPDAPVSSFDLELPEGPHSALAANGSLCGKTVTSRKRITRRVHGRLVHHTRTTTKRVPTTLLMPTTITGQNGAVLHQNTKIAVTGCPKPRPAKKAKKKAKARGRGRR